MSLSLNPYSPADPTSLYHKISSALLSAYVVRLCRLSHSNTHSFTNRQARHQAWRAGPMPVHPIFGLEHTACIIAFVTIQGL